MHQASDGAAFTDDLHTRRAATADELPDTMTALGTSAMRA
jgi:hypothetical protein